MSPNLLLPLPVLAPLTGAGIALALHRHPTAQRWISVGTLSTVVVIAAALVARTDYGTVAANLGGWDAPIGISLVADRLSALLLLVSAVVLLCVLAYGLAQGVADRYGDAMSTTEADQRDVLPVAIYHPSYLILAAGVALAFLAGDLFNLYVGFEVFLAASYVLLTLGGTRQRIRAGNIYVIVALASSLVFVIGVGLTYAATGTLNMAQLAERLLEAPPGVRLGIQLMMLIAFGIKAALFPLSAWLPDSYPTAPAPVTAVFAGLLTKVGVYAIIRTQTLLFPPFPGVSNVLMALALATMLAGILGAVTQDDLKRLLSFTLISHIGFLVFGVALTGPRALAAAIFYMVHHITVQTALFLVAGLIERRGGTTSLDRLGGLAKVAPGLAILFFLPAMNLAGVPQFSGFLGKVGLLQAGVAAATPLAWVLVVGSVTTSLLTLYALIRAWNRAFWQESLTDAPIAPRTVPAGMVGAAGALVAASLALTVFAAPIYGFVSRAAAEITGVLP